MGTGAEDVGPHPGWRRGDETFPTDALVRFLTDGAQHHARHALNLYRSHDQWEIVDAAAHAGGSVELLAKACIASVEPALLAKPVQGSSAKSILHLRGHGRTLAGDQEPRLITIDASVAITLASRLFPRLSEVGGGANAAREARNDAVHMTIAVPDSVEAAVAGMVRYAAAALAVLGVDEEDFWGNQSARDAAAGALDLHAARVQEISRVLINLARARWVRTVAQEGLEGAERLADLLMRAELSRKDENTGYPERCLACGHTGWVSLDADYDVEGDGDGGYRYTQTGLWVDQFECPVCYLQLDSEQCESAGITLRRSTPRGSLESAGRDEFNLPDYLPPPERPRPSA